MSPTVLRRCYTFIFTISIQIIQDEKQYSIFNFQQKDSSMAERLFDEWILLPTSQKTMPS
jgi:hypothetical protein